MRHIAKTKKQFAVGSRMAKGSLLAKGSPLAKGSRIAKGLGFSLLELMITIAVAGVFLIIAIPSYSDFIARNRVDVEVQEFRAILTLARTEAVKQNRAVTVNGINNWEDGYVLALASVTGAALNSDGPGVLRRYVPEDDNGITPTLDGMPLTISTITFLGTGLLRANSPVEMQFCSDNTIEDRLITINVTGRYSSAVIDCDTI